MIVAFAVESESLSKFTSITKYLAVAALSRAVHKARPAGRESLGRACPDGYFRNSEAEARPLKTQRRVTCHFATK
jgi:hypothetical protein